MCEADDSLIFLRIFQKLVECTAESIYGAIPVYEKECKSMAKVTRKDFRELTVSEATNYGRRTTPMLRIQGLWLQELGFNVGDPVLVKKLQERFLKEKKELHARFVAERRVEYGM